MSWLAAPILGIPEPESPTDMVVEMRKDPGSDPITVTDFTRADLVICMSLQPWSIASLRSTTGVDHGICPDELTHRLVRDLGMLTSAVNGAIAVKLYRRNSQ
jgi:hypothetical protein